MTAIINPQTEIYSSSLHKYIFFFKRSPLCLVFSRQEILDEVVRELQKVKDEIINGRCNTDFLNMKFYMSYSSISSSLCPIVLY